MKKILEYLLVFIMTLIEKNSGFKRVQPGREYTYLHLYADSVILNIINCIDTNITKAQ